MTTNLYRVIHPVKDIEIAARFYSEVLDASGERISPGRHYFDCEGTILACYDPIADGDAEGEVGDTMPISTFTLPWTISTLHWSVSAGPAAKLLQV